MIRSMMKYGVLATGFLFLSSFQQSRKEELSFNTSDSCLQQTFNWAKATALSYVGASTDPVGPWYEASLPQREAFCMRDVSHQCSGAGILGLDKENFNLLAKFAQNISESKDWCTYWEINRYDQPAPIDYRNDKEFWYNLNANFDVLDACYRTYLWTGDQRYINDKAFLTFYEKTMTAYMERWQLQADKIMDRPRFMNSPVPFNAEDNYHKCRGLASYVENFEGLTVSADLLAAIYRGCISYSELLQLKGDAKAANRYIAMAENYATLLEEKWWDDSSQSYHTFFTGSKEFHKGEGETFILWFGIAKDAARIRATLAHLLSKDWNVENLSYFAKILYSYAYNQEAYRHLITLPTMERSEYPEVSYSVIDGIVAGMAGIQADASKKQIRTLSRLTKETEWIDLQHLPVMQGSISVRHDQTHKTTFKSHINQSIRWKAVFPGLHTSISCNGKPQPAIIETDLLGNIYSYVELEVVPEMQVIAICE
ncbi:hypothetical protein [Bacteroides sp.]